jgi:hypothetical protein
MDVIFGCPFRDAPDESTDPDALRVPAKKMREIRKEGSSRKSVGHFISP